MNAVSSGVLGQGLASPAAVASFVVTEPFPLHVDFLYGGIDPATQKGTVMLYPKGGNRKDMKADVREQFDVAGVEPLDGMAVQLIDLHADADDEGRICHMVVIGTLRWAADREQWYATYQGDDMTWVPSESREP